MEQFKKVYDDAIGNSPAGVIGYSVQLKTTFGEQITGEVFNFDATTQVLTLKEASEHPKQTFRIINTKYVENINIVNIPEQRVKLNLPQYNIDKIRAFAKKATNNASEDAKKIGVGVSKEAQQLFDAMSKTYLCAWHGKTILVVDADIKIEPPYTDASCFGSNSTAVARVKKIVQGERLKINGGNWS